MLITVFLPEQGTTGQSTPTKSEQTVKSVVDVFSREINIAPFPKLYPAHPEYHVTSLTWEDILQPIMQVEIHSAHVPESMTPPDMATFLTKTKKFKNLPERDSWIKVIEPDCKEIPRLCNEMNKRVLSTRYEAPIQSEGECNEFAKSSTVFENEHVLENYLVNMKQNHENLFKEIKHEWVELYSARDDFNSLLEKICKLTASESVGVLNFSYSDYKKLRDKYSHSLTTIKGKYDSIHSKIQTLVQCLMKFRSLMCEHKKN